MKIFCINLPGAVHRIINGRNKARHCEQTLGLRGNLKSRDCFALLAMTHSSFLKYLFW